MSNVFLNVLKSITLNRFGVRQYPSFVTFFVTWACNHRCVFCDVWKKTPEDEMSFDEIIDIFKQLRNIDVLRISGGEPFLRKDLAEIVNEIDSINKPSIIHFTTNGILTDRIIRTIEALHHPDKVHIKVSLDDVGENYDQIRGVSGAYGKALETIKGLVELRDRLGFHVGVNQAILDEKSMGTYDQLKAVLAPYKVPIYASVAYDSSSTLYSEGPDKDVIDPDSSLKPFGKWSDDGLKKAMTRVSTDNKEINSITEQIVDTYFFNGLYERMVEKKNSRGPSCVALNNHLRLLPNGDIPICLYNGTIVGNLRDTPFRDFWFGDDINPHRKWVADCSGCWTSCETTVSGIYTGDIWKGLKKSRLTG